MLTATQLIKLYNLQPHPEGGFYKETYKSQEMILQQNLPQRFLGNRSFGTAIYFLLQQGNFSAFHKIKSDECWHFYAGQTLLIYVIHQNGSLQIVKLGSNILEDELFQFVVPANCWFASIPAPNTHFSFVGCTVCPGFDFEDFELANAKDLCNQYPTHSSIITQLCR